jgi:hypothetical protein
MWLWSSPDIHLLLLLHEHKQGLGLTSCSFKAPGVFGLSIFPSPLFPLYSFTSWSVWVSRNKLLSRIFGLKRDEVTGKQ